MLSVAFWGVLSLLGADWIPVPVAYASVGMTLSRALVEAEVGGPVTMTVTQYRDADRQILSGEIRCSANNREGSVAWAKYLNHVATTSQGLQHANWPPLSEAGPLNSDCDIRAVMRDYVIVLEFIPYEDGSRNRSNIVMGGGKAQTITVLARAIAQVHKDATAVE